MNGNEMATTAVPDPSPVIPERTSWPVDVSQIGQALEIAGNPRRKNAEITCPYLP
jgi:hypothetical protein